MTTAGGRRVGALGLLAGVGALELLAALGVSCSPPPPVPPPSREVFLPAASASGAAPAASLPRPVASTSAVGGACRTNADCVPAQCCHPSTCVAVSEAPTCAGILCTRDCRGGSFECGGGTCACQAGVCGVDWRTPPAQ